jgi:RimJ/RimL family protein N-acetyltransferase
MKISVDEARAYFDHPTQRRASLITPDKLPQTGVIYDATGGVCGCFHDAHWPGVVMAHYGVLPEAWGSTVPAGRDILQQFAADYEPQAIIGWTAERNRAALAFARRLGFREYGRLELPSGTVIKQEWKAWA